MFGRGVRIENDGLIADESGRAIDRVRVPAREAMLGSAPDHERGVRLVELIQAPEIDIAAIENVDGTRLGEKQIEDAVVHRLRVGDPHEGGNGHTDIQEHVHLQPCLGRAKPRPRKNAQTQIDDRRIERVHRTRELDGPGFARVEAAGLRDQQLSELGVDAPVPALVCIGQRAACNRAIAQTAVVQLLGDCMQARLDVAQALAMRELSEGHDHVLIPRGQASDPPIAAVPMYNSPQRIARQMIEQLRENRPAFVHERILVSGSGQARSRNQLVQVGDSSRPSQSFAK